MAKIKLGTTPKTFPKLITVPLLDGQNGTIEMVYVYRTRSAFSEFLDQSIAYAQALERDAAAQQAKAAAARLSAEDDSTDPTANMVDLVTKTLDRNTDYILSIATGWNLDVEYSRESVRQLCDEYPNAAKAVMESYQAIIMGSHLGN